MSSSRLKTYLHGIGALLAVVALAYVVHRLWLQADQLPAGKIRESWPGMVLGTGLYLGCGLLLSVAWWLSLRIAAGPGIGFAGSASVYLISQLGKYLPGNVAHFAARHALCRQQGISHPALLAGAMIEASLLLLAATLCALMVFGQLSARVGATPLWSLWVLLPTLAVVVPVLLLLARRRGWLPEAMPASRAALEMLAALGLCFGFFAGSAVCYMLVADQGSLAQWQVILPWVAAAWLLGFVIPGAPGGLGVRELVLTLGLAPLLGEASALVNALLFRIVTVGGDVLMTALGALWLRSAALSQAESPNTE